MVVSLNRGIPIKTPKYYNPYYRGPQKGTPNFGKPPYDLGSWARLCVQEHLAKVRVFRCRGTGGNPKPKTLNPKPYTGLGF